jgi:N-acetylglucosaminyldiphosphoundecaprenol N-acetyl-beta-D-mannosaminyltransferase
MSNICLMRVCLLGIAVDLLTFAEAVAAITHAVEVGSRGYVVTPNVDHVVRLHRDPRFRAAYAGAMLRLPDGMPLVWVSRLLGRPVPSRVAGADLLPALCAAAASRGYTVFLLGGRAAIAAVAAAALSVRAPGLRIVGTHSPPDDFTVDGPAADLAVAAVARARPDLLFVGLGSPTQELWVHRYWDRLACTVAVCCGAAIDYAAGVKPRAPLWMQRAGLEWLWRLAHEPRRLWRRYLVDDVAFVGIVLREWWRLRVRKAER